MTSSQTTGVTEVLRLRCSDCLEGLVGAMNELGDKPLYESTAEIKVWATELMAATAATEYVLIAPADHSG
jgi:hypothetical protein